MMSLRSITTWTFKPEEPFILARHFSALEGTALLYSGGNFDSAHSSFLCLLPYKKITIQAGKNCWEELTNELGSFALNQLSVPRWVGYLGYEMGCFADPDKTISYIASRTPAAQFYAPSVVIHYVHATQIANLYSFDEKLSFVRQNGWRDFENGPKISKKYSLGYSSDTLETYLKKIALAKEWILDGEIYQVNLSQEMHLIGTADPFNLFEKVVHINPAPFNSFLNCGSFSLVSSSPERFLSKKGIRLQTRPIKGTAPRAKNPRGDFFNKQKLLTSEKERSELLMITDLMRSDLGKVALPGSVQTIKIWQLESYTNVFHLLSVIEGCVEPGKKPVELIRNLFPGGSITGCPKLSAMEAIADLEKRPRGVYTGSIGYFAENGDFDFNIAIRTLIVHAEYVQLQLGGAIVIDSDPVKEFHETLHKGHSLFSILGWEG